MNARELLRYFLNLRVIGGAIFIATMLSCATSLLLWVMRPGPTSSSPTTVVLNVISVPTATKLIITPTADLELTPSLPVLPSPPPGEIAKGALVQVTGTGGDGLRLRAEPGLSGEVRFLGLEAEVFRVADGPEALDSYTWWFLVAPYDESVNGWAVSNYIVVVQNP